jgi:hypothetical protein
MFSNLIDQSTPSVQAYDGKYSTNDVVPHIGVPQLLWATTMFKTTKC